jgi:uridine kinase
VDELGTCFRSPQQIHLDCQQLQVTELARLLETHGFELRISLLHPAHQVSSKEIAWQIAVRLWSYAVDALRPIVDWISSLELGHPTRVGLDGPSAAGKTTPADALAEMVQSITNRPVIRASIDDFHRPGHKFRSMREEWTTQSYYDESYDYLAFRDLVLRPLGADGNGRVRTAVFDSFHDVPMTEHWQVASENTILFVDGVYLQREELRSDWDYLIWLKVDAETIISRARQCDVAWVRSPEVVEHRYRTRVLQTHAFTHR